MIDHADTKPGAHYWAKSEYGLLVVLRSNRETPEYEVCGPWECGIDANMITIIEEIPRPAGHEEDNLYYG